MGYKKIKPLLPVDGHKFLRNNAAKAGLLLSFYPSAKADGKS